MQLVRLSSGALKLPPSLGLLVSYVPRQAPVLQVSGLHSKPLSESLFVELSG
jgi:hypothetical protein